MVTHQFETYSSYLLKQCSCAKVSKIAVVVGYEFVQDIYVDLPLSHTQQDKSLNEQYIVSSH